MKKLALLSMGLFLSALSLAAQSADTSPEIKMTPSPNEAELTPNGDGINDYFDFTSKNMESMTTTIYDLKGNVVYELDGKQGKWDGTEKSGRKAQSGFYIYSISAEGKDGKKYKQEGKIKLTRE